MRVRRLPANMVAVLVNTPLGARGRGGRPMGVVTRWGQTLNASRTGQSGTSSPEH